VLIFVPNFLNYFKKNTKCCFFTVITSTFFDLE
jgi:hypothetical protein